MKLLSVVIALALLCGMSFAQSDDPDIRQLDSLRSQLDSTAMPDNEMLLRVVDSLSTAGKTEDFGSLMQLGQSKLSAGSIAEALAEFDKAVQLVPNDPRALSLKGEALTKLGRTTEALPTLSRAIELDPHLAGAHFSRAGAYTLMNNPEAALQDLQAAFASDPTLKDLARISPNFQSLHDNPEFKKLVK